MANDFPFRKFEYYMDFLVTYNDNCTISLYYDTYTYTGGAHGITIRHSDTWDLQRCKLMSVTDYLVDKTDYRKFLINEITEIIEDTRVIENFIYFDNYEQLIEDTFKVDNFYLTDENNSHIDGIIIYFNQYDIAPYASGLPTFLIPFSNENLVEPAC